jgi:ferric-dicitrate binding protein FerR (iron transport regulator)
MTDEKTPSDEFVRELARALEARGASGVETSQWRADVMWGRFVERWKREEGRERRVRWTLGRRVLRMHARAVVPQSTWGIVAGFLVCVGFLAISQYIRNRGVTLQPSVSTITYTTGSAERAKITLPDGSTVMLNVASRLDIPSDYAAGDHAVRLSGEAFFDVQHQSKIPFTVTAGPTIARVLGTSFVVRRYPTDTSVVVAVRTGKIAVRSLVIAAGEQTEFVVGVAPKIISATQARFAFVNGTLRLSGIPLSVAIQELNRWYDADIRLGDPSLATRHVKGEFVAGSLTDLVAILEWTFDVRVERNGRVLTLYPETK